MVRVGSMFGFDFYPLVVAAVGLRGTMNWIALVPIAGLIGCLVIPSTAQGQTVADDPIGEADLKRATSA